MCIDLIGPLQISLRNNRYALTILDLASNYPDAYAIKNADSESVARALVDYFCRVGLVEEIQSDQGSCFMAALMQQLTFILKIKQIESSVYHPQSNAVERLNARMFAGPSHYYRSVS